MHNKEVREFIKHNECSIDIFTSNSSKKTCNIHLDMSKSFQIKLL